MLTRIGESNVAIDPAIGGYGVEDIYLGEFSPQYPLKELVTDGYVVMMLSTVN